MRALSAARRPARGIGVAAEVDDLNHLGSLSRPEPYRNRVRGHPRTPSAPSRLSPAPPLPDITPPAPHAAGAAGTAPASAARRPGCQPAATIRMSLEPAKVMAIILRKQLNQFEEQLRSIKSFCSSRDLRHRNASLTFAAWLDVPFIRA